MRSFRTFSNLLEAQQYETALRNMYYHFLGRTTTETNFDLILSSPDDECFQIVILFLVWAQCISSSLKSRITELQHHPDSQVISQREFRLGICCTLSINIVDACFDHRYSARQFCKLRYRMLVGPINLSLWYYVKDNVVLQALCPSSNCLYTKSKGAQNGKGVSLLLLQHLALLTL